MRKQNLIHIKFISLLLSAEVVFTGMVIQILFRINVIMIYYIICEVTSIHFEHVQ